MIGAILAKTVGLLVLVVLAGGLTEASFAMGHRGGLANDIASRITTASPSASPHVATPTPKVTLAPTATPLPATPTPAVTPVAAPVGPTATTNSFVHMRAGKSTATAILVDLNGGTVVRLLPDSDAQWQQVSYNGTVGYVFKTYLAY